MKKPLSRSAPSSSQPAGPSQSTGEAGPPDGRDRTAPAPDAAEQARVFEQAMRCFQAQDFLQARRDFERAARGPLVEMSHAARQRARMCEQRLVRDEPVLGSPEDRYNYAVVLMNERRWEEAEGHLRKALAENPTGDHLYYALALCCCWRGDLEGAAKYMQRAIELQPKNLIAVRNDADFARFIRQSPLAEIVNPGPKQPG